MLGGEQAGRGEAGVGLDHLPDAVVVEGPAVAHDDHVAAVGLGVAGGEGDAGDDRPDQDDGRHPHGDEDANTPRTLGRAGGEIVQ